MICFAFVFAVVFSLAIPEEVHGARKKVIEWGWDEPDPSFIKANIRHMELLPFDGLVFHVISKDGANLSWETWGRKRFEVDDFRHAIEDLRSTDFDKFRELFLRVNVTPGDIDWFDEEGFGTVLHNFGVAARIAKEGGCRGFMFDVEQYQGQPFDYGKQARAKEIPFERYASKVRERGRQWIREVNKYFTDITILLTFGYEIAGFREGKSRADSPYGLLADFLDGILEACSPKTRIVNAWESSYPYKTKKEFRDALYTIKFTSLKWTSVPDRYRKHVRAGFGIWMDCDWRRVGWNTDDFRKNYFTPEEFEEAVRYALKASDQYVWIYTEQPRWWTRERLPEAYINALAKARK